MWKRFPLKVNGTFMNNYVDTILYGNGAWCLRESDMETHSASYV